MTCFIYNTYITYIIITYITTSSTSPTSPTSSAPSSLHHHSCHYHHHHHHHYHHHHHLIIITTTIIITIIIIYPSHLYTPPTVPTQTFSINLIYMTYIMYNAYMTDIINYITTSSTSPTVWKPHITYNIILNIYNIDNITYISYRWSTSRELLQILKNVIYTGVDLQVIHFYLNSYKTPARSFAQKLLHRSCYTGVQVTSRW